MGEDAALQEGVELCFDKLGQPRPGLAFDLGQEGFEVLLDQLVEDGVLVVLRADVPSLLA